MQGVHAMRVALRIDRSSNGPSDSDPYASIHDPGYRRNTVSPEPSMGAASPSQIHRSFRSMSGSREVDVRELNAGDGRTRLRYEIARLPPNDVPRRQTP